MKKALSFVITLLFSFTFSIADANLITNGSFEDASITPGSFSTLTPYSDAITGWTVWSGSIDYIGTYWTAQDGVRSIDLNGTAAGSIKTYFSTIPGEQYRVDFFMAGNPAGDPTLKILDVRAYYNGTNFFIDNEVFSFDASGKSLSAMGWESHTFYFTAPSDNATLLFGSLTTGAFGPAIDNVVVTQVTGVPEPSTIVLLVTALFGLTGVTRFRK